MVVQAWGLIPRLAGATVAVSLIVAQARRNARTQVVRAVSGREAVTLQQQQQQAPLSAAATVAAATTATRGSAALRLLAWASQQRGMLVACVFSVSLTALTALTAGVTPLTAPYLGPQASIVPLLVAPVGAAILSAAAAWLHKDEKIAGTAQLQQRVVDKETLQALSGTWSKDFKASGSMDPFFALFSVPRMLRKAAVLMRGLEVSLQGEDLVLKQVCALPWFSVIERFPLDGSGEVQRRRDMRSGGQRGTLLSAEGGQLALQVAWGEPLAGWATDTLQLKEGGKVLLHEARAQLASGGTAGFTAVYHRSK